MRRIFRSYLLFPFRRFFETKAKRSRSRQKHRDFKNKFQTQNRTEKREAQTSVQAKIQNPIFPARRDIFARKRKHFFSAQIRQNLRNERSRQVRIQEPKQQKQQIIIPYAFRSHPPRWLRERVNFSQLFVKKFRRPRETFRKLNFPRDILRPLRGIFAQPIMVALARNDRDARCRRDNFVRKNAVFAKFSEIKPNARFFQKFRLDQITPNARAKSFFD